MVKKMRISNFGLWILMAFLVIAAVACKPEITEDKGLETSQELKKFSSVNELREYLQKNAQASYGTRYFGGVSRVMTMEAAESAAPSSKMAADSGASQYSTTNIQVEGVDEADFVKNDGKHIYTLTQNKLVIVDAFPAENAKVLSETKLEGSPRNMLVNKDRLVVFSDGNGEEYTISQYDYLPRPRYTAKTHVLVYDISNREEPELVKDYNMNGYYFESRMIGDNAYFLSK